MFEKILVYIDGTEESLLTARYAITMAKIYNLELFGVYVVNLKVLEDLVKVNIFIPTEQADYEKDMEVDGQKYLNYLKELAEAKGVRVETVLAKGNVAEEVKKIALSKNVNIVIISQLKELLSRSEAFYDEKENIIHRMPMPVFIVKEDKEKILNLYNSI